MAQQPPVDQGLPVVENSGSHSDTPQSVGLLWTSNQPEAKTSTRQQRTLTRHKHYSPARFEPTISAIQRKQTHALDREATGIGLI
jgi:hypothetical protein